MPLRVSSSLTRAPVTRRPVSACARLGRRGARGNPYKNGHDISVPVTLPMAKLPEDGEILTEQEMKCDPEERNCQTPMFVYEERCPACSGTGQSEANGPQRRLGACPMCGGIGYLRHVTSRHQPSVNGSLAGPTSLFRPKHVEEEPPKPKKYGDWK